MSKQRKQYSAELKFEVALEAAKNSKTVSQLASEYGVLCIRGKPKSLFNNSGSYTQFKAPSAGNLYLPAIWCNQSRPQFPQKMGFGRRFPMPVGQNLRKLALPAASSAIVQRSAKLWTTPSR